MVEGFFAVSCNVGLRGKNKINKTIHTAAFRRWVEDKNQKGKNKRKN